MSYGKSPIRRSNVFEIEDEDLTELVRQAFCLTHRRHEFYMRELEQTVMNDPAKVPHVHSSLGASQSQCVTMDLSASIVGAGERNERTSTDL